MVGFNDFGVDELGDDPHQLLAVVRHQALQMPRALELEEQLHRHQQVVRLFALEHHTPDHANPQRRVLHVEHPHAIPSANFGAIHKPRFDNFKIQATPVPPELLRHCFRQKDERIGIAPASLEGIGPFYSVPPLFHALL